METANSDISKLLEQRQGAGAGTEKPPVSNTIYSESQNNFWGGGPEFKEPEKTAQQGTTTPAPDPNKPADPAAGTASTAAKPPIPPAGIPDKVLRESAAVTVSAIEMPVKVICGSGLYFQLTRKMKKRFPEPAQGLRAAELAESDLTPKDAEEERLKKVMLRLIRKHAEKEKALPFTEAERSAMEEAWYQKYKIEQKTMSPDTLLICSMTAAIGSRMFDLFTDW